jgi:hypothetical protein
VGTVRERRTCRGSSWTSSAVTTARQRVGDNWASSTWHWGTVNRACETRRATCLVLTGESVALDLSGSAGVAGGVLRVGWYPSQGAQAIHIPVSWEAEGSLRAHASDSASREWATRGQAGATDCLCRRVASSVTKRVQGQIGWVIPLIESQTLSQPPWISLSEPSPRNFLSLPRTHIKSAILLSLTPPTDRALSEKNHFDLVPLSFARKNGTGKFICCFKKLSKTCFR